MTTARVLYVVQTLMCGGTENQFMTLGRLTWIGPRDELDEQALATSYLGGAAPTTPMPPTTNGDDGATTTPITTATPG